MAKLYKVRKKCLICGNIFYPRYAGSLYCEECKNRKKEVSVKQKPVQRKAAPKEKSMKKPIAKASKKKKSPSKKH